MADQKISELNAKTTVHDTDLFPMVDVEAETDETKKITGANLKTAILSGITAGATKFTPKAVATALWRRDIVSDSPFEALINGTPTATSVVYDNDVRELSLPDATGYSQWGVTILHNVTRGNSRRITRVDVATNTITTVSSTDNWADNDVITTGSPTCVAVKSGYTYSSLFDINISAQVPATAIAALIQLNINEKSGASTGDQNEIGIHEFATFATSKLYTIRASAAYDRAVGLTVIPVINQKICLEFGRYFSVNASGMVAIVNLWGYWE